MRLKGVSYDVGRVMGLNWRPDYHPRLVQRELQVVRDGLHCNAVRICGKDLSRLCYGAQTALDLGLKVWLSPELWGKSPQATLAYLALAADMAERLRKDHPEDLVLVIASECTLFMQGIIPGRTFSSRMKNAFSGDLVREGKHNGPLNRFMAEAVATARRSFKGSLSYASLIWEAVDWSLFDFRSIGQNRSRTGMSTCSSH